jgi:hypothetical protein
MAHGPRLGSWCNPTSVFHSTGKVKGLQFSDEARRVLNLVHKIIILVDNPMFYVLNLEQQPLFYVLHKENCHYIEKRKTCCVQYKDQLVIHF